VQRRTSFTSTNNKGKVIFTILDSALTTVRLAQPRLANCYRLPLLPQSAYKNERSRHSRHVHTHKPTPFEQNIDYGTTTK
jgi:hypothetical protein